MNNKILTRIFAATALGLLLSIRSAPAHHSFAMFDIGTHMLVEGRVVRWDYNSPHSWLHIEFEDNNGEMQRWSFEGAAPVHAARQGVTGNTFTRGDFVRVVMSPLRDGRPGGAMCFVEMEDGSKVRPNDSPCNSVEVIANWEEKGWLDSTGNLGARPHEGNDRLR